jgi:hypothetical protein
VVECLPTKCEAQSSNPIIAKRKKNDYALTRDNMNDHIKYKLRVKDSLSG